MSQAWEQEENNLKNKNPRRYVPNDHSAKRLVIQEIPSVIIKQSMLQIGRYCECGCGQKIPNNARKDRRFFNSTCRRNNANQVKGYSESKNIIRARLQIKKPIMLSLYPGKGIVIKIRITNECREIMQFCKKLELERTKGVKEVNVR